MYIRAVVLHKRDGITPEEEIRSHVLDGRLLAAGTIPRVVTRNWFEAGKMTPESRRVDTASSLATP